MLQITPQHTILLALQPVDFRKGVDGLVSLCKQTLNQDPFSGTFFVFRNKSRTTVKIIIYDGQGFWLVMKRFSCGKLAWWPTDPTLACEITAHQLQILLHKGVPPEAKIPDDWRKLKLPVQKKDQVATA